MRIDGGMVAMTVAMGAGVTCAYRYRWIFCLRIDGFDGKTVGIALRLSEVGDFILGASRGRPDFQ